MISLLFELLLGTLAVIGILLARSYDRIPARELKRRANNGDELAKLIYRVTVYGRNLPILLWLIILASITLVFVLLSNRVPPLLALLVTGGVVWIGFAIPIGFYVMKIATVIVPALNFLLDHGQPFLNVIRTIVKKFHPVTVHTGLYEREDLIQLIEQQKVQSDSRFTDGEIELVKNALQFGVETVNEVMTPKRMIISVSEDDDIGPVKLTELHTSGHSRFPVHKSDNKDEFVGTLFVKDIVKAKASGKVKKLMRKDIFYIQEDHTLVRVLDAFVKTKHHQFLVVNEFEEIVGLITLEDVLEKAIGKTIVDEFDQYDDLRAVAATQAKKAKKEHKNPIKKEK